MDAVVVAVLLELGGIFALKEGRNALKAFLEEKDAFILLPIGFGRGLIKHCKVHSGFPLFSDMRVVSPNATVRHPGAVITWS